MAIRDSAHFRNLKRSTRSAVEVGVLGYGSMALVVSPLVAGMFEAGLEVRP